MRMSDDSIPGRDFQTDYSGSNSSSAPIDELVGEIESLRRSGCSDIVLLIHSRCSCKVSYHLRLLL
jgi:hypothetical protein